MWKEEREWSFWRMGPGERADRNAKNSGAQSNSIRTSVTARGSVGAARLGSAGHTRHLTSQLSVAAGKEGRDLPRSQPTQSPAAACLLIHGKKPLVGCN